MSKVSVLMPTYNFARYLGEAIESVLTQDHDDFELLIVDDCSKDNSAEIIKSYAARDKRIRFQINSPNLGMVPNWNLCMEMARGDYLKFVFGDDKLCRPDALRKMVSLIEQNSSVTLVASARNILDENSKVIDVWDHLGKAGVKRGLDVIVQCLDETRNVIGEPSAVLFRKRDACRGFNPRYRQIVDQEFWFHLLEKGDLAYTPEPLCAFRTHPTQQTAVNRAAQVGERESIELLAEYFAKPEIKERSGRRIVFNNLYRLERNRRKIGAPESELEQKLRTDLGDFWYRVFWFRYKMLRPFENLRRSIRKRANRRRKL